MFNDKSKKNTTYNLSPNPRREIWDKLKTLIKYLHVILILEIHFLNKNDFKILEYKIKFFNTIPDFIDFCVIKEILRDFL